MSPSPRSVWSSAALAGLLCACSPPGCGTKTNHGDTLGADERKRIPGIIAFVSERGDSKDVWLVRPTGEQLQLTDGPEDEFPGAVKRDGSALVVVASYEKDGVHKEQLRLVSLTGTDDKPARGLPLHEARARARNPSWSPDGSFLVAESDEHGFSDLVRLVPGGQSTMLTSHPRGSFEPSVAPDGKRVAFVSSRDGDPDVYVMDVRATDARSAPEKPLRLSASHREDRAPLWSPTGEWIAFISDREARSRVFVVRPDGTDTHAISGTADTGDEREPAWSPDGRGIAFVGRERADSTRIWLASMDGGDPIPLTDGAQRDDQPAWSPDGRYLVYVSARSGEVDLYLMRADGSARTRLTTAPGADWLPRWSAAP